MKKYYSFYEGAAVLNIKKALKRYKAIFVTFIVLGIVGIICFVLDYFNIPFKIGFNFNFLNLDFWGIFLSNGIVVALFITTFILFDKRNLEKDKLSTYAGILTLKDIYGRLNIFLDIYEKSLNAEDEEEKLVMTEREIDYFKNDPFKSDDKIFECLEKGQINKDRFDAYQKIKMYYRMLFYYAFEFGEHKEIEKFCFDQLKEELNKEKEIIEAHIKD